MTLFCNTCKKEGGKELKVCGGCKSVHYCDREHQVADWAKHKELCKEVQEAGKKGFVKRVLQQGDGKTFPKKGDKVKVHYVGTLVNGSKFDSSRDRQDPFVFPIGMHRVITGWDEGVMTMSVGEKSLLICSPSYAYGEEGAPPEIPGNSTLVFEVELLGLN